MQATAHVRATRQLQTTTPRLPDGQTARAERGMAAIVMTRLIRLGPEPNGDGRGCRGGGLPRFMAQLCTRSIRPAAGLNCGGTTLSTTARRQTAMLLPCSLPCSQADRIALISAGFLSSFWIDHTQNGAHCTLNPPTVLLSIPGVFHSLWHVLWHLWHPSLLSVSSVPALAVSSLLTPVSHAIVSLSLCPL